MTNVDHVFTFIREFAREPTHIGAVAPSSDYLAEHMVRAAQIEPGQPVVELGAGTGPITQKILEMAPDSPLLALEPNPELAAALRQKCPEVEVVEGYAHQLPALVQTWGHARVPRIVSSLPWAMWPKQVQDPIFDAIVHSLTPDGRMVTFTYLHSQVVPMGIRLKKTLHSRFDDVLRTTVQWRNLPPAFVWVCSRPRDSGHA